MARKVGGLCEGKWDSILGVTVNAVGTNLAHPFGNRLSPGLTWIVGALIPHHHRKQYSNATLVKFCDQLPNTIKAAGHRRDHIELVAIINSKIWVIRPQQNGVDAAIALLDVGQIPIDGIFPRDGIVQIAILDHRLWLNETRLRPL